MAPVMQSNPTHVMLMTKSEYATERLSRPGFSKIATKIASVVGQKKARKVSSVTNSRPLVKTSGVATNETLTAMYTEAFRSVPIRILSIGSV